METYLIKNHVKENVDKLITDNALNITKTISKKISSKGSLV